MNCYSPGILKVAICSSSPVEREGKGRKERRSTYTTCIVITRQGSCEESNHGRAIPWIAHLEAPDLLISCHFSILLTRTKQIVPERLGQDGDAAEG